MAGSIFICSFDAYAHLNTILMLIVIITVITTTEIVVTTIAQIITVPETKHI